MDIIDILMAKKAVAADIGTPGSAVSTALNAAIIDRTRPRRPIPIASDLFAGYWTSKATAAGTSRVMHTIAANCRDLQLIFGNHQTGDVPTIGTDTDGPSAYTVSASLEIGSTIYRVTFGGKASTTIDPGGLVVSDPLGVSLSAGATIWSRTYVSVAGGTFYSAIASYGYGGGFATGDLTAPGSAAIPDSTSWLYAPVIVGVPDTDSAVGIGAVGDSISIGYGSGTSGVSAGGGGGWISRGASGKAGAVIVGHSSERAALVTGVSEYRRWPFLQWCSHIICELGVNDVNNGDTLATIQANLINVWKMLARSRAKIFQTTITPTTNSTDGWATTANQTVSNATYNSVRISLNGWIRAGAPMVNGAAVAIGTPGALTAGKQGHPLAGYLEVADYAETARDSGIWRAGYTGDGIHPNQTGTHPTTGLGQAVDLAKLT